MSPPHRIRFGLWYDFRNPSRWRQDPATLYRATLDQIVRAEALGWDDVWLSEHHFVEDDYSPSLLPLAAAIAARTERVQIGTSVVLLPLHDPLRIAEDAATVDVVSNGRLQLGLAIGYRREEFTGFGIARQERAARMNEALPILRRLFAGERVSTDGPYYRYTEVTLRPRPIQPSPTLWVGGFSSPAVRRAARLGDAFIATGPVGPLVQLYREELVACGEDPDAHEVAAGLSWLLVARDPERRWQEAIEHLRYAVNLYAAWFAEAGMTVARTVRNAEELRAGGVRILSPEQAAEAIAAYLREVPVTRFYGWTVPPGLPPEWSDEHLELMAREVIPAFR